MDDLPEPAPWTMGAKEKIEALIEREVIPCYDCREMQERPDEVICNCCRRIICNKCWENFGHRGREASLGALPE